MERPSDEKVKWSKRLKVGDIIMVATGHHCSLLGEVTRRHKTGVRVSCEGLIDWGSVDGILPASPYHVKRVRNKLDRERQGRIRNSRIAKTPKK